MGWVLKKYWDPWGPTSHPKSYTKVLHTFSQSLFLSVVVARVMSKIRLEALEEVVTRSKVVQRKGDPTSYVRGLEHH
jgi:hypothetical protein